MFHGSCPFKIISAEEKGRERNQVSSSLPKYFFLSLEGSGGEISNPVYRMNCKAGPGAQLANFERWGGPGIFFIARMR